MFIIITIYIHYLLSSTSSSPSFLLLFYYHYLFLFILLLGIEDQLNNFSGTIFGCHEWSAPDQLSQGGTVYGSHNWSGRTIYGSQKWSRTIFGCHKGSPRTSLKGRTIFAVTDSISRDERGFPLTQYITNGRISRARYTVTHFKYHHRVLRLISNRMSV